MYARLIMKTKTTSGEKSLTRKQVKELLAVVNVLEDKALLELAISGGLRRSDIVAINSKDVDFENSCITFYEKKKSKFHTVFLPERVMNTIEMSMNANGSRFLFPSNREDSHISSRTAYNKLQMYLKKAKIKSIPFHALRSTCIKLCQIEGWSETKTAKHVDDTVRTIQNHYTTPSVEEMKETAREKPIL